MMKNLTIVDPVGALCMDDYKGINNQYVDQGKVVIVENLRRIPICGMERVPQKCYTTMFRWMFRGGSENIVTEEKAQKYLVRRLTPTECERLQGLPDNYTLIDDKTCSDSARYKALGNGMAQPCADFIIKRIVEECD